MHRQLTTIVLVFLISNLSANNESKVNYPCHCPVDSNGTECGGDGVCFGNEGLYINAPRPEQKGPTGPGFKDQVRLETLNELLKNGNLDNDAIKAIKTEIEKVEKRLKPDLLP